MEVFKSCGVETSDDVCIEMEDDVMVIVRGMIRVHVQIKVPSFQSRCDHTADVFHFNARLADVILFGGVPEWPKIWKSAADFPMIAQTTVLRFGECDLTDASHTILHSSII